MHNAGFYAKRSDEIPVVPLATGPATTQMLLQRLTGKRAFCMIPQMEHPSRTQIQFRIQNPALTLKFLELKYV